jgi:hypothetical protein
MKNTTFEERSESSRKSNLKRDPEEHRQAGEKGAKVANSRSPEERAKSYAKMIETRRRNKNPTEEL